MADVSNPAPQATAPAQPQWWYAEAAPIAGLQAFDLVRPFGRLRVVHRPSPGRPALLLLPGLNEPWHSYAPVLRSLTARFSPYLLEWRGHGASRVTAINDATVPVSFGVVDYAADVVDLIDRVVEGPVIVAGNSMGALAAVAVQQARPARVAGMVLEDGPFFFTEGQAWEDHWLQAARFAPLHRLLQERDRQALDEAAFARLHAQAPAPVLSPPGARVPRWCDVLTSPQLAQRAAKDFRIDTAVVACARTRAFNAGFDHANALAAVSVPTLVLQADPAVSPLIEPQITARVTSTLRPELLRQVLCTGAGHEIHRDDPERYVNELFLHFMSTTRA
jgi:pimeloyl-ACP methyl ester carboxylesterase